MAPPGRSTNPAVIGVVVAVIVIVAAFAFLPLLLVGGPGAFPGAFVGFLCIPFIFVIVFLVIALASSQSRRTIPPPPPIQQPMVPAGQQGPVALSCPNCGGPPTNVDRFGIATCSYCGTRFLVR